MKKFFSLLLVLAMGFSMFAITANAAEEMATVAVEFAKTEFSVGDNGATTLTFKFVPDTAYALGTVELYVKVKGLTIDSIASVKPTDGDDSLVVAKWAANKKSDDVFLISASDFDGNGFKSAYEVVANVTVDTATAGDVTVEMSNYSDNYLADLDGNTYIDLTDCMTGATATVKAAGPSVKTLEAKDVVTVNGAKTKADGTTTDEQIGGAAALTVTIPDGVTFENNMIWSLTTADGKLFSKKLDTGLTALSGTVKLAATFVTGSHRTGADVYTKITGVNAIFKAVDGDFYYTDAADADAQAK